MINTVKRFTLFMLLIFVCFKVFAFDEEQDLINTYTNEISLALQKNEITNASSLLDDAFNLNLYNSDLLFLSGSLKNTIDPFNAYSAIDLEKALDLKSFYKYSEVEASVLLLDIYLAQFRYDDAFKLMNPLYKKNSKNQEILFAYLKALYYVKNYQAYYKLMESVVLNNTSDSRFARFFLEHEDKNYSNPQGLIIVAQIKKQIQKLFELDKEILLLYIPFSFSQTERKNLIIQYLNTNNDSISALIWALKDGILSEEEALIRFKTSTDILFESQIEDFYSFLSISEVKNNFIAFLNEYTGTIFTKDMESNFYNSSEYKNSFLIKSNFKRSSDTIYSLEVLYNNGIVNTVNLISNGKAIYSIHYEEYPLVYEIKNENTMYLFSNTNFEYSIILYKSLINEESNFYIPSLNKAVPSLNENVLKTNCSSFIVSKENHILNYTMNNGLIIHKEETVLEKIINKEYYKNGLPVYALEDVDLDGYFEVKKSYLSKNMSSELEYILVDRDQDGIFEYKEVLLPNRALYWDYNYDGIYDAGTSYDTSSNETIEFFSSKLDGVFDIRIRINAQKLILAEKNGMNIPISSSQIPNCYWIGKIPIGKDLSTIPKVGYQILFAQKAMVYSYMSNTYIELLEY